MGKPGDCLWPALQRYDEAIEQRATKKGKEKLGELDRWYRAQLKEILQDRPTKYITQSELVRIVDWKLTRGTWRPKLLDYAKSQPDALVKSTTREAFEQAGAGDVEAALGRLMQLKGVGVATASAILAIGDSSIPFMSDEAMQALLGKKGYTMPIYRAFLATAREEALSWADLEGSAGKAPTVESLEMALWAASVLGLPVQLPSAHASRADGVSGVAVAETRETATAKRRAKAPADSSAKRRKLRG